MNWYYAKAGQQAGPVDEAQLDALLSSGQIDSETLVWREGMANWQPHREARPSARPGATAAAPGSTAAPPGAGEAVCTECGKLFPIESTIQYGNARVCAGCKPVFMQKLAEGAKLGGASMSYAGFWIRFIAVIVDGIIMIVISTVIKLAAGLTFLQALGTQPADNMSLVLILGLVQGALAIGYEVVMIGKYGATLGKMAVKVRVVTADGGRVSYWRALGRYFAKIVSWVICGIGYIMAAFDEEKRALHDRICNTRVIMR